MPIKNPTKAINKSNLLFVIAYLGIKIQRTLTKTGIVTCIKTFVWLRAVVLNIIL